MDAMITARVPQEMLERLEAAAQQRRLPKTTLLREALSQYLGMSPRPVKSSRELMHDLLEEAEMIDLPPVLMAADSLSDKQRVRAIIQAKHDRTRRR
jgi:hypothetical protein